MLPPANKELHGPTCSSSSSRLQPVHSRCTLPAMLQSSQGEENRVPYVQKCLQQPCGDQVLQSQRSAPRIAPSSASLPKEQAATGWRSCRFWAIFITLPPPTAAHMPLKPRPPEGEARPSFCWPGSLQPEGAGTGVEQRGVKHSSRSVCTHTQPEERFHTALTTGGSVLSAKTTPQTSSQRDSLLLQRVWQRPPRDGARSWHL